MCLIWFNMHLFPWILVLMMSLSLRAVIPCTLFHFPVSFWLEMAYRTWCADVGSFMPILRIQTLVLFLAGNEWLHGLTIHKGCEKHDTRMIPTKHCWSTKRPQSCGKKGEIQNIKDSGNLMDSDANMVRWTRMPQEKRGQNRHTVTRMEPKSLSGCKQCWTQSKTSSLAKTQRME